MPDHPQRQRVLSAVVGATAGGLVVVIVALVLVVGRLSTVSHQQAVSLKASASTRVTTVTQRCALTADVEAVTRLDRNILLRFVPPKYGQAVIVAPYDKQLAALSSSYAGCVAQLRQVIRINEHTPSP